VKRYRAHPWRGFRRRAWRRANVVLAQSHIVTAGASHQAHSLAMAIYLGPARLGFWTAISEAGAGDNNPMLPSPTAASASRPFECLSQRNSRTQRARLNAGGSRYLRAVQLSARSIISRDMLLLHGQGCNMPRQFRKSDNDFRPLQCGSGYCIRPNSGETPLKTATSSYSLSLRGHSRRIFFSSMGAAGPLSRPRTYAPFLRRCGASRRGGRAGQRRGLPAAPMCH
jgi:hypothetical protein